MPEILSPPEEAVLPSPTLPGSEGDPNAGGVVGNEPPDTGPALEAVDPPDAQVPTETVAPEKPRIRDNKEILDANTRVIRALALQEYKRNPPATNVAQQSLCLLGDFLAQPPGGKPLEAPLRVTEPGRKDAGFLDREGLPRLHRFTKDGQEKYATSYDKRKSTADVTPTDIASGDYELQTFNGRNTEGNLVFMSKGSEKDEFLKLAISDGDYIKAFIVAQKHVLRIGIEDAQKGVVPFTEPSMLRDSSVLELLSKQLGSADSFVKDMDKLRKGDPTADVDLIKDVTPEAMVTALEKTGLGPDAVKKFATGVGQYITTAGWEGNSAELPALQAEIKQIIARLDSGLVPQAKDISRLIIIGSNPHLEKQKDAWQKHIDEIQSRLITAQTDTARDNLKAELDIAKQSLNGIQNFQAGDPTAEYNVYIKALSDGEVDIEDTNWFTNKLKAVTNPWAILKDHDHNDPDCLAGKAFRHLTKDMEEGDRKKVEAWLSKFFREKGSDIAMMGIFALFQMMTSMIGDAAQKASH